VLAEVTRTTVWFGIVENCARKAATGIPGSIGFVSAIGCAPFATKSNPGGRPTFGADL
jgi:hypothetical protein